MKAKKIVSILVMLALLSSSFALAQGYTAGTYEAAVKGFGGEVKAVVTFDSEKITDVALTGDSETPAIGGAALETVKEQILAAQGTEIDGVAGATVTVSAVKDAVNACMAQAAGVAAEEKVAADGVYTGSAFGFMSEIKVEVTMKDNAIADMKVVENNDTGMIGVAAGHKLAANIVEHQSLAVDTIAGATVSSNAVLAAAAQALEAAGADVAAYKNAPVELRDAETVEMDTDIVVIGAGMAGFTAAMEAAEAGKNVILLERSGVYSSSTTRSEGFVMGAGTEVQKSMGIEDHAEDMYKDMYELYAQEDTLNTTLLKKAVDDSDELIKYLTDHGVIFETILPISALEPRNDPRAHVSWKKGDGLMEKIVAAAEKIDNLTIYMDTTATELKMMDGAVVGVKATNPYGDDITINAKATILCSGSYGENVELISELNPKLCPISYTGWGNGDGWYMAKNAGAKMVEIGYMASSTMYMPKGICDLAQPYVGSPTLPLFNIMQVNMEGQRLINEDAFTFDFADLLYKSDAPVGWAVAGAKYMEQYPTHYADGKDTTFTVRGKDYQMAYQADTIEELAEMTGMDAAILKENIERYNASCDKGVDEEFGKNPQYMERIDAPYIAMLLTCAVSDAFSGCVINENAQVLDTEGNVIPGFYAAGTCAMPEIIGNRYYGCGSIIMTCGVYGRTAGIHAASAIQ